jgi:hypothetical protein
MPEKLNACHNDASLPLMTGFMRSCVRVSRTPTVGQYDTAEENGVRLSRIRLLRWLIGARTEY